MISIITLTYNNYEDLLKTLSSIKDISDIESVVVNGGDCKKTSEFLKSYNGITINERDAGISDAFNKGIKSSSGKYIMFLNSGDELLEKSYLKRAVEFLDSNPEYSFVHSNIMFIDESGEKLFIRPPMQNIGRGMPYLHPTMIIRKYIFDRIGLFRLDLKIAMDYDLIVRMQKEKLIGFYFDSLFPVMMEGSGKSVKQEYSALKECFRVLKENNYLTIENLLGYLKRFGLFVLRKTFVLLGLSNLLLKMKKIKHHA